MTGRLKLGLRVKIRIKNSICVTQKSCTKMTAVLIEIDETVEGRYIEKKGMIQIIWQRLY